ncbi:hypothetical protein K488DRAFT_71600 [Vararia minispora EC-137]|uniref:Uncharacterized protein n=1 Tax=Vararia minispora EC-137 TaxID=1314806 RepID=A0ACB8QHR4_9AGAM|nr:hypothetical protein K488DRAFT_71600 [Vararia minispora EC-137]
MRRGGLDADGIEKCAGYEGRRVMISRGFPRELRPARKRYSIRANVGPRVAGDAGISTADAPGSTSTGEGIVGPLNMRSAAIVVVFLDEATADSAASTSACRKLIHTEIAFGTFGADVVTGTAVEAVAVAGVAVADSVTAFGCRCISNDRNRVNIEGLRCGTQLVDTAYIQSQKATSVKMAQAKARMPGPKRTKIEAPNGYRPSNKYSSRTVQHFRTTRVQGEEAKETVAQPAQRATHCVDYICVPPLPCVVLRSAVLELVPAAFQEYRKHRKILEFSAEIEGRGRGGSDSENHKDPARA